MGHAELDPLALGLALGILDALSILLLGVLGRLGYAQNAVWITMNFIPGYSLRLAGIVFGALECGAVSFALGWLLAHLYNRLSRA